MAQKTEERIFLGRVFQTTQLPAMRAIILLRRILAAILPAIGAAASGAQLTAGRSIGDMLDDASARMNLGDAVKMLFDALTEKELVELIREMFVSTLVDGQPVMPQFDLLFQGQIETVPEVLKWVFEVNYGSFYEKVAGAFRAATTQKPTTAKLSVSPAA